MSKKNGRPESWNADYFPHHTEVSMELKYLEHTYGAEGYRAYWRIQEQLAKADYHYLNLEKEKFYRNISNHKEIDTMFLLKRKNNI